MAEYKIGAISKLLGIPAETLRYYETCGILAPHKDSASGYRSYTPWDLNKLVMCRLYRSCGFPLNEVQQMLYEDDRETLYDRYINREAELIDTIRHYQNILRVLAARRRDLALVPGNLGRFRVEESPELLLLRHRYCYELNLDEEVVQMSHRWLQALPTITLSFEVPQHSIGEEIQSEQAVEEEYDETLWGFTISLNDAAYLGLKLEPPVEYLPPRKSVHTIFAAGEEGTFLPAFSEQVLRPLKEQGFRPDGTAMGQTIAHMQEGGKLVRYYHVWIPVK